jgi:hypothetical protein
MIDEYDKNYFLLSCDICGITEEGPFETFDEAVQYKRDNPEEWKSVFMRNSQTGKFEWVDVCANKKCLAETPFVNWKRIPVSKRNNSREIKTDSSLTDMANSIAKTITERRENL